MSDFTFIDLFAGIGGFHVAMEGLGGECVFASEIDEDARSVYQRAFPEFANEGVDVAPGQRRFNRDIRDVTGSHDDPRSAEVDHERRERILSLVPPHDVLCAGFPCQPFSKSGHQRGINETRGTLFYDILRILEVRRPKYAILENVRNLAGPRQRDTWETIVEQLRELNYRVADEPLVFSPHLLPPWAGGTPQIRDRVFILCEHVGRAGDVKGDLLVENAPQEGWSPKDWRIASEDWIDRDLTVEQLAEVALRPDEERWIVAWQDFTQNVCDQEGRRPQHLPGFPVWVDAWREEPDEDAPTWKHTFQVKNRAFYLRHADWLDGWIDRHDVPSFPNSRRKFEWQARSHQRTPESRDLHDLVWQFRPSGLRVKPPTYLPALVAITQTSILGAKLTGSVPRSITPREATRLQGLPEDHPLHPHPPAAYKQLGNAVNVGAVRRVASALFDNDGRTPTQRPLFAVAAA